MDMPASAAVETQPRIFDIILLNDELSVLDIRLNELDSVVDMFVIVEATTTFTGIPKTLHYQTHQRDFARFWHKIIHVVLSPPTDDEIQQDNLDINNPWEMEKRSRDKGLATALNIYRPEEGDWILLSDLDEIPRPSVLKAMKEQDTSTSLGAIFADQHRSQNSGGDLFRLETRFYYYSYEFRHRNSDWVGPVVVRYREADSPALVTNGRSDLDRNQVSQIGVIQSMIESNWKTAGSKMRDARNSNYATYISDAGWHCTWCFSTVSAVISKVTAYSHREHNQGQFKELSWILDRFSKGLDLFDRENENYDYVSDENDVPAYIAANREKFSYMLHRWEQPNAGFTDLEPDNPEVVARKKTKNAENEVKDKNVSIGDATEKS
ncbi:hypothetical protein BGZ99_004825 [Dissophora globulifera]|uniref:Glycosyltransferase family 17 protein n=1 Tax=Dissophora globulifera TaxID=979702 RepID=A0A9P6RGU2_9FUNG|nr:hypothetical protein BGZ99_004825 [Dissophora globulifera]